MSGNQLVPLMSATFLAGSFACAHGPRATATLRTNEAPIRAETVRATGPVFDFHDLAEEVIRRSALRVVNLSAWDLAVQLETVAPYRQTVIGVVRAGETALLPELPSEKGLLLTAITQDGRFQLRRPSVQIGVDETLEWHLLPESDWRPHRR